MLKYPDIFVFYVENEIKKTELCDKLNKAKMMISNTNNYTILNHILDHLMKISESFNSTFIGSTMMNK